MNVAILHGTVVKDAERNTSGKVVKVRIVVDGTRGNDDDKLFIDVHHYGKQADVMENLAKKGKKVIVQGSFHVAEYGEKDARKLYPMVKSYNTHLVRDGSGGGGQGGSPNSSAKTEDSVPF